MRSETQHWDRLTARAEFVTGMTGISGLTVEVWCRNNETGLYFDPGPGTFSSPNRLVDIMAEIDVLEMPGVYVYEFPPTALQPFSTPHQPRGLGTMEQGYTYGLSEPVTNTLEYCTVNIVTDPAEVWAYNLASSFDPTLAGGMARCVSQVLGLHEAGTFRYLSTAPSLAPDGKFYQASIGPSAGATEAYANRVAIFKSAADSRSYPCVIVAVANDGADYFQLQREDGTAWDIDIAVSDEILVTNRLFQELSASSIWGESMALYQSNGGSFGEGAARMLSARQENMRVHYTAWNAAGVPTDGKIWLYPNTAAMIADATPDGTGSFAEYTFDCSFTDGMGGPGLLPTDYRSGLS